MIEPEWSAWVTAEGSFCYRDYDDVVYEWSAPTTLARDWWADSAMRTGDGGESGTHAHSVVDDLLDSGHPQSMVVIQALVDSASSDDELDFVGASPLEDLLSHRGHGLAFVDDVERRARQQDRFRKCLTGVWLNGDVPAQVRQRLGALGARLI